MGNKALNQKGKSALGRGLGALLSSTINPAPVSVRAVPVRYLDQREEERGGSQNREERGSRNEGLKKALKSSKAAVSKPAISSGAASKASTKNATGRNVAVKKDSKSSAKKDITKLNAKKKPLTKSRLKTAVKAAPKAAVKVAVKVATKSGARKLAKPSIKISAVKSYTGQPYASKPHTGKQGSKAEIKSSSSSKVINSRDKLKKLTTRPAKTGKISASTLRSLKRSSLKTREDKIRENENYTTYNHVAQGSDHHRDHGRDHSRDHHKDHSRDLPSDLGRDVVAVYTTSQQSQVDFSRENFSSTNSQNRETHEIRNYEDSEIQSGSNLESNKGKIGMENQSEIVKKIERSFEDNLNEVTAKRLTSIWGNRPESTQRVHAEAELETSKNLADTANTSFPVGDSNQNGNYGVVSEYVSTEHMATEQIKTATVNNGHVNNSNISTDRIATDYAANNYAATDYGTNGYINESSTEKDSFRNASVKNASVQNSRTENAAAKNDSTDSDSIGNEISEGLRFINVDQLFANPEQPRKFFKDEDIQSLARSIQESGVLQPILVRPLSDSAKIRLGVNFGYEIIAGERRFRAAQIAGLSEVPVIVKSFTDRQSVEIGIVENIQRADLNPIEEATAYLKLSTEFGQSQEEIAKAVGRDRASIANALRLLKLPKEIQNLLSAGKLTAGHARALLSLESESDQKALVQKIIGEGLSVRIVEQMVAEKRPRKSKSKIELKDPATIELEERLRRALGTKVKLISSKDGTGELRINFFSGQELHAIMEKLGAF